MLKKFMLWMKSKVIAEAKFGTGLAVGTAVDRLYKYSQAHQPGAFNVVAVGNPSRLVGGFNAEECDRLFASGSLRNDWVMFLSFLAIVRLDLEVSRRIGRSDDVIDPVPSSLYPDIEQSFRDRFGVK